MQQKIHNFFENPKSKLAIGVHFIIIALIFLSAGLVILEWKNPEIIEPYAAQIKLIEYFILGVFTLEYVLRFLTAPNKEKFFFNKFNLIDLIAIVPFYLGIQNTALLRILRLLRLLKVFRYLHILEIFKFKGTVLEKITPLLLFLVILKGGIWIMEVEGLWIGNQDLGELFAIIGFALGIILAQKVGTTYGKYLEIEEMFFRLRGSLESLVFILDDVEKELGTKAVKKWLTKFLEILERDESNISEMKKDDYELYQAMKKGESSPAEMALFHKEILSESNFCFGKKGSLTPKAYDNLLKQATIFYLMMTAIFIPGVSGMISVFAATYMLYGMYHVTQDFDSAIGGEYDLISVDTSDLKQLLKSL